MTTQPIDDVDVSAAPADGTTAWHTYVPAPADPWVVPVQVQSSCGSVTGAAALTVEADPGVAALSSDSDGDEANMVLDYGRNVAGVPWIEVEAVTGSPTLRVSYSESAAWLGPDGDAKSSHNDSGNRERVETFAVAGPGRLSTGLLQGGQRYQRIALTGPGTVQIRRVGIEFTAYRATPDAYQGWFLSSSDQLNRIWYAGAYTTQLNQVPARSIPTAWSVRDGALHARGGHIAVLRDGGYWTDLDITFDVAVQDTSAGWVVGTSPDTSTGRLLVITTHTHPTTPNTLQLYSFDNGHTGRPQDNDRRFHLLAQIPLGVAVTPHSWHQIHTRLRGAATTVTVDDRDIDLTAPTKADPGIAAPPAAGGTVGFRQAAGQRARFRRLRVTVPDGGELYAHTLDDPAVLADFTGDAVRVPNPLPVIVDGGKRDRTVWSGDLLVQAPTVFYSTAAEDYVRGSLLLLNGYQEATGQSAARVPPVLPFREYPQTGQTYSAVYSMHQVTNQALHYRYTGDLVFLRSQWAMVERQMAYSRSLLDGRGLVVTDSTNGLDWDWYDGPKTGAVTAYNCSYHQTLTDAAELAAALGHTDQAVAFTRQAGDLRVAVNTHLYDPDRHLYALSDQQPAAVAQDGNALAVVTGVAPDGDAAAILTRLAQTLPATPYGPSPFTADTGFWPHVSPYVADVYLRALFTAGLTTQAHSLISQVWGHMVDPGPHTVGTLWELVAPDGSPGFGSTTSLAHGWSCGPTVAASAHILGVQPTTAGYQTWLIAPQPGPLAWAQGRIPTPHGPIEVSWTQPCNRLQLQLHTPAGTSGQLRVPVPAGAVAVLDGTTTDGTPHHAEHRPTADQSTVTFAIADAGYYQVSIR